MKNSKKLDAARKLQDLNDCKASLARNIREGNTSAAESDRRALALMGYTVC